MWHKAIWKGHPMRLELTHVGLLVELANHYTTRGALQYWSKRVWNPYSHSDFFYHSYSFLFFFYHSYSFLFLFYHSDFFYHSYSFLFLFYHSDFFYHSYSFLICFFFLFLFKSILSFLGKIWSFLFPHLWVEPYHYCSSTRMDLALNNPWRLICH